jgi:hypothetical protein
MLSLGNISKKHRHDLGPKLLPPSQQLGRGKSGSKKIQVVIKEAKRSTLLFNLDMGKVPLVNKETMNKKATLALAAMAAKKEKKNTSIQSEDAVAAIDDCLSATTGMDFFGATTKTYRNPKDSNSQPSAQYQ